ncbi:MAG: hypothetical protein HFG80_10780 [Eubacterium sp.]|nr:hypothetical protein [Eubacterium sp.]
MDEICPYGVKSVLQNRKRFAEHSFFIKKWRLIFGNIFQQITFGFAVE